MKKLSIIILTILTIATPLFSQSLDLSWIEKDAKSKTLRLRSGSGKLVAERSRSASTVGAEFDLTYLRLLFTVDPAEQYITGSIMNYFRVLSKPPHSMSFDMHDSLKINIIRYHDTTISDFTHENNVLTFTLPEEMAFRTLDSVMIDYQGVPVMDGLGSFSTSEHEGVPLLATLSQPYGAKDWWPCKQDLNDKIDSVLVVVTCPEEYRTASNGVLIAEDVCNGNRIMQWKHDHPIAAYLIAIAVTNYEVYRDYVPLGDNYPGDSIEILNYVYPEDLEVVKNATPGIIEVFHLYNELFGLYPYADEKYGHAQWEWGGGMEHQTMSFMGSFDHDLMAHELAHQWFGDYVTCASWTDIWLNEGFATYLTGITYEHMFNGIYWEQFKRLSIDRILKEPGGSVFCSDTTDVDRIFDARLSYSKGAMVLHSLRWEMGDEAFFQGIRNYYKAFANSYANTNDFMLQMEAAADTTFQEFFNDWIYGEGYPTYQFSYSQDQNDDLEISIYQTQSHPSVDFFEMHVPFTIRGINKDTTIVVHHTEDGQTFKVNPGMSVSKILLDPDRWIITKDPVIVGIRDSGLGTRDSGFVWVYPNPAGSYLFVELPNLEIETEVQLINQAGQVVLRKAVAPNQSKVRLDVKKLANGIYYISTNGKNTQKIVIGH